VPQAPRNRVCPQQYIPRNPGIFEGSGTAVTLNIVEKATDIVVVSRKLTELGALKR
jgi:hypothetical protein